MLMYYIKGLITPQRLSMFVTFLYGQTQSPLLGHFPYVLPKIC